MTSTSHMITTLQNIQTQIATKIHLSIYAKRTDARLTDTENISVLLENQGFKVVAGTQWESIPKEKAQAFFVQLSTRDIVTNEKVFEPTQGVAQWQAFQSFCLPSMRFYTNIVGADAFVAGDSFAWQGIAQTHFEAALMCIDEEKVVIFLVVDQISAEQ